MVEDSSERVFVVLYEVSESDAKSLDRWDGATLTHHAGTPAVGFGPPGFDPDGVSVAHTIDEYVPVDGLVGCAQGIAVAAMRYCGVG